jgi:hypothetical protein
MRRIEPPPADLVRRESIQNFDGRRNAKAAADAFDAGENARAASVV